MVSSVELDDMIDDDIQYSIKKSRQSNACQLQEMLYQQSLQGSEFCDVTLSIGNTIFKAHSCVLVMCPYFQSLFNSGMKESMSDTLTLDFGVPYAMTKAIKFIYTGDITVSLDDIQDVLEVADYLQLEEMIDICLKHLEVTNLTLENCVKILLIAGQYNLPTYDTVLHFVNGHLPKLLPGDDLIQLSKSSILDMLSDPTLSYVKSEDFFHFIVRWVRHNEHLRLEYFEELLCSIDLFRMPRDVLSTVILQHPLVLQSEKCQVHVNTSIMAEDSGLKLDEKGCVLQDVIVVCGGVSRTLLGPGSRTVFVYLLRENRWVQLPDLPYPVMRAVVAVDWDSRVLVVNCICRDEELQLLSCCPYMMEWTTTKIRCPQDEQLVSLHSMLASCKRLFVLASSCPSTNQSVNGALFRNDLQVKLFEIQLDSNILVPVCQFFRTVQKSQVYAVCQQGDGGDDVGDCRTMNSKVVYIVGKKVKELHHKKKGICYKLFSYNLVSGHTRDLSRLRLFLQSMHFGLSEGFLSCSLGIKNNKMYSEKAKHAVYHKRFSITEPPTDPQRDRFCFVSVNDDVYVIGGMVSSDDSPTLSVARFSLPDQSWTELNPLPGPRILSSVARGRFPLDVLRCHLHCPHCPLFTVRGDDDVHLGLLSEYSGDGEDYDSRSDDYYNDDDVYGDYDDYLDLDDDDDDDAVDYFYGGVFVE